MPGAPSRASRNTALPFARQVYGTNFSITETPLYDHGAWVVAPSPGNTQVAVSGGIAQCTQPGTGGFDDSIGILRGFPANHSAEAIVHKFGGSFSGAHEVEIILRATPLSSGWCGYECNLSYSGNYCQIIRIDGPGVFTYLSPSNGTPDGVPGSVTDGAKFSAQIIGSTINVYYNDTLVRTATDSTYATGNPGLGFFRDTASSQQDDYGFVSYRAWAI